MIIRQQAFIDSAKMLKGGLHCHTTRSDGAGDPADVIRMHAKNGYDFLAVTDHRFYNFKNFAPETDITIIPGMEMDRNITSDDGMCFHTVCIGPETGNGYAQDQTFERGEVRDQFEFQKLLDDIHAHNNMTMYCHPDWSCTPARSFEKLRGNFAMEIWNSGCAIEDDMDTNALGWDEILRGGQKLWGAAVDDGHAMDQHCNGWVCVNAENNVPAILSALKNGAFYSSCGPEIHDFYIDGNTAHIECSPCRFVCFINGRHPNRCVRGKDGLITSVDAELRRETRYLRATVMDENGKRAWTNPIFLED